MSAFDGMRPVANAEEALAECRIMADNAGKANGCIGRSSATTGQYVCVCVCGTGLILAFVHQRENLTQQ